MSKFDGQTVVRQDRRCRRGLGLLATCLTVSLVAVVTTGIVSSSQADDPKQVDDTSDTATNNDGANATAAQDDSDTQAAPSTPEAPTTAPAVTPTPPNEAPVMPDDAAAMPSGTRYIDLKEGDGQTLDSANAFVTVHYKGMLTDGTVFDDSVERDAPVTMPLDQTLPGWREGLQGMPVGGKRRLWIPADQAYGEKGVPPVIPPNSDLIFDVDLIDIDRWARLPETLPGDTFKGEMATLPSGVQLVELTPGTGDKVDTDTKYVRVNAKAFLVDGRTIYDSSERGGTFVEDLPVALFPGWGDGLQGLAVGGRRKLVIPWSQTFVRGNPQRSLPPGATIIFDVSLIELDPWSKLPDPLPGWDINAASTTTDSGLKFYDIQAGEGESPSGPETNVRVHYTGYLVDGSVFDSSHARGTPIDFRLGQVIPGWTEGVGSMKPGGKRKLVIPSELAYGTAGSPPAIPPYALLIFDVELIEVDPSEPLATPETTNGAQADEHDHSGHDHSDHDHSDHDHSDHDHSDHDHSDHDHSDHDHSDHDHLDENPE